MLAGSVAFVHNYDEFAAIVGVVAGRQRNVCLAERPCHLVERDPVFVQEPGIQIDVELPDIFSIQLHFFDAGYLAQMKLHLLCHQGKGAVGTIADEIDRCYGEPFADSDLGKTWRVDAVGQLVHDAEDFEAQLPIKLVIVCVVDEFHHYHRSFTVRGGADELHRLQVVQGLFNFIGNKGFHLFRRSARQYGIYLHLAHLDIWIAFNGQIKKGKEADGHGQCEEQVDQDGLS